MNKLRMLIVLTTTLLLSTATALPSRATSSSHAVHVRAVDRGTFTTQALDPPLVLTRDTASGYATHIGRYTLVASEVINLDTLEVTHGEFVITSAGGSTLVGSYEGTASPTSDPAVITYDVVGPVTGGTGRFEHARGQLTWHGVANLATGQLADRATGWLVRCR